MLLLMFGLRLDFPRKRAALLLNMFDKGTMLTNKHGEESFGVFKCAQGDSMARNYIR